jgi:hypothetical protein
MGVVGTGVRKTGTISVATTVTTWVTTSVVGSGVAVTTTTPGVPGVADWTMTLIEFVLLNWLMSGELTDALTGIVAPVDVTFTVILGVAERPGPRGGIVQVTAPLNASNEQFASALWNVIPAGMNSAAVVAAEPVPPTFWTLSVSVRFWPAVTGFGEALTKIDKSGPGSGVDVDDGVSEGNGVVVDVDVKTRVGDGVFVSVG